VKVFRLQQTMLSNSAHRLIMSLLSYHGMQPRTVRATLARNVLSLRSGVLAATLASLTTLVACGGGDDPIAVVSVSVTPPTVSVATGNTTQLAAATLDGNGAVITGRNVTWSTANASIATVSGGLVTGVAPGNVTITATSDGKTGSSVVTVTPPPVATISITPAAPTMSEIDTLRLTALLKSATGATLTGRVITWTSGTPASAVVSSSGLVSGVAPGTTVITATSEGKSATAAVTVLISPCNLTLAVAIVPGTPVNGTLAATDCPWVDNTFADIYKFDLAASTNVEIRLKSTVFDAYLYTFSRNAQGQLVVSGVNDDEVEGVITDSRLSGIMPAGTHYIVANSFDPASGAYVLTYTAPFAGIISGTSSFKFPGSAIKLERPTQSEVHELRALMRRPGR